MTNENIPGFWDGFSFQSGESVAFIMFAVLGVVILFIVGGWAYKRFFLNPIEKVTGAPRRAITSVLGIPGRLGSRLKFRRKSQEKADVEIQNETPARTEDDLVTVYSLEPEDILAGMHDEVRTEPSHIEVSEEPVGPDEKKTGWKRFVPSRPDWTRRKKKQKENT